MHHALRLNRLAAAALAVAVALSAAPPRAAAADLAYANEWEVAKALARVVLPEAPDRDAEGLVVVKMRISAAGAVTSAKAALGPDPLRAPAERAVAEWRYAPLLSNGKPVDVETTASLVYVSSERLYYAQAAEGACYGPPGARLAVENGRLAKETPSGAGFVEMVRTGAAGPGTARVSGGVLAGKMKKRVQPSFPTAAREAGVEGEVVVEVIVERAGFVVFVRPVSGHSLLQRASVDAARQWTFSPTTLSGKPVNVIGTIRFNFKG